MQNAGLAEGELVRVAEQQHEADGAAAMRAGDDADAERVAAGIAQRIEQRRRDERIAAMRGRRVGSRAGLQRRAAEDEHAAAHAAR